MKHIIFDCDSTVGLPGKPMDDALALLYLLGRPAEAEVLGITCTFGNGSAKEVVTSTTALLQEIGRTDIPLLPGANRDEDPCSPAARFIADTVKFSVQLPCRLERAVAEAFTVSRMASGTAADHILLRQFFPAHKIPGKNRFANFRKMFGTLRIIGIFIKPTVPQRLFSHLQNIFSVSAVNHTGEPSVPDGHCFYPPSRRLLPKKFHSFSPFIQ